MAGNPANAALWTTADVYVAPVGTTMPADVSTPMANVDPDWSVVGLLNGENGFVESREEEVNQHFAWGGLLVRISRAQHQRNITFTALEDNDAVFELLNPGSTRETASGLTTATVKVPTQETVAMVFETRDGDKVRRRCVKTAQLQEVGEVTESESELRMYEITMALLPQSDSELYVDLIGTVSESS